MNDEMRFKVESGSEVGLNIEVVDVKLTQEYLILSIKFDNKKESQVANLRVLRTDKVRELLGKLDRGEA